MFSGLARISLTTFQAFLELWRRLPITEQLYLIFTFGLVFFLMQAWRSYTMHFSANYSLNHGIYSDDFLYFFMLLIIGFITSLVHTIINRIEPKVLRLARLARIVSSCLVLFLFFLSFIWPSRIAATDEATFTWQFYLFGLFSVLALITGYLGIATPSTPLKTEQH